MPAIIVHTLLGVSVLDRWQVLPSEAPFPVRDGDLQALFLTGCCGPDMGMYPGGAPLFSDLAHYVLSGKLAHALVHRARDDRERAFAWGWFSHVLADVLIHPLINLGVGDATGGMPLTYAQNPALHVAIETAVDGSYYAPLLNRGIMNLEPVPLSMVDLLERSYRSVYGEVLSETAARSAITAWNRWHSTSIAMAASAAQRLFGAPRRMSSLFNLAHRATRTVTKVAARRSLVHALTNPMAPSKRSRDRISAVIAEYPDQFLAHFNTGLMNFPNYNLDTGEVEHAAVYPLTVKTLAHIHAKRQ